MTAPEDPTVMALRRLAAEHAPDESWQPDAPAVLHRGRVLRARRRTSTAGAGALVLALAIAVPAMLAQPGAPVTPGLPTQTATPPAWSFGTDEVATLEPGFDAIQLPVAGADGSYVTDVGGATVRVTRAGDDVVVDASTQSWSGVADTAAHLPLHDAGAPAAYTAWATSPAPYASVSESTLGGPGNSDVTLITGILPSWQREPTAHLFSVTGWQWQPDVGTTVVAHTAWLPTFHPPGDDTHLMYVALVWGDAREQLLASPHTMVFYDDEGEAFWPQCGRDTGGARPIDALGTCAESLRLSEAQLWEYGDSDMHFDWKLRNPSASVTPGEGFTEPSSGATSWPDAAPAPTEIAPGVLAATGAGAANSDGGFTFSGWAGATVTVGRDGADSDSLIEIGADKGMTDKGLNGTEIVWKGVLDPSRANVVSSRFDDARDGVLVGGTAPPSLGGVRVFVTAPSGFPQAGGGATSVLEVPTFLAPPREHNPVPADRPWFLVDFTGDVGAAVGTMANGVPDFNGAVVFAGADGTIQDSRCTYVECTDADSQEVYADIRARLEPGHVVGIVYARSGINPTPGPVETRVTATPTGTADSSGVRWTDTASDGSFAFDLPPGSYQLTATPPGQNSGTQSTPHDVIVAAGGTSRVDIEFIAP
jgi:hypothetical protein